MSYSEKDGQVVLTLSREDYEFMLKTCGGDCWRCFRQTAARAILNYAGRASACLPRLQLSEDGSFREIASRWCSSNSLRGPSHPSDLPVSILGVRKPWLVGREGG